MTWNDDREGPMFVPTDADYRITLERIRQRRRTKVKAAVLAAGGATVAGLVAAILSLGGGGTSAVLQQEQPASGGSSRPSSSPPGTAPTPGASPGPQAGNATAAGAATRLTPAPSTTGLPNVPPPVGRATPTAKPQPTQAGVTRSYTGTSNGAAVTVCNGPDSGRTQAPNRDTFCAGGYASPTAVDRQRRVPIQSSVCENRSEINSKKLTFETDRVVDYPIYQGSSLIWRWSAGGPAAKRPGHSLAIDPGQCWEWLTTWRAVDDHGEALHGKFVLKSTSFAKEVTSAYNPITYNFTL